ncbi:MAG: hypothetical protein K0Q50_771, partial [Vampirovibrio sp.]|nr:hypothetical protein [Vampirovibrio sp.]
MSKSPKKFPYKLPSFKPSAQKGYGLALLVIFLSSSILIGASTAILLAPSLSNAVGAMASDDATARQLAEEAIDAAKADMLTKQQAGTTIDTSYRYPSVGTNTISVPTYPGSASSTAKGTYYVTATYARGFSFLLQATVTVGANIFSLSRLVQVYGVSDPFTNALAIYSLRKVKSSYSSYAARVRCASNPSGATTQDIGFDGSGNFDMAGLRTCLGDSTLPLDVATGEKLAYGLRKLSSSYAGYAIRVRSSGAGSPEQDIGFDANGNLDTVALKSFIGSNSGYIKTWYDQSGSGKNITQTTTTKQPRIVNAGIIETKNGQLSAYFDGTDDSMSNTTLGGTLITGTQIRAFLVSSTEAGGSQPTWGEFAVLWKSGDGNSYEYPASMEILCMGGSTDSTATNLNNGNGWGGSYITGRLYQHTSYHNASFNSRLYRNGTLMDDSGYSDGSTNLAPTDIIMGTGAAGDATTYVRGYISELIIFNANVSAANQQAIERNQGHYYNITGMQDGYITTWYDQSGNGRNATQATTANQPVVVNIGTISSNGTIKPGIQFDGSNDCVGTAVSTAWPSGSSSRTMNAIYKLNATGSTVNVMGWGSISTGTYSGMLHDPKVGFWGFNADVKSSVAEDSNYGHRVTVIVNGSTTTVYTDSTSTG